MKHLIVMAAMLAGSLTGLGPEAALAEPPTRQITVTGEGRIETVPDMATITLGVTHQADEAGTAMAATSQAVAQVLTRLEAAGIAARDMQTRQFSLNPVWSNRSSSFSSGEARITGFVASNTVLVRVRDLDGLSPVLDAVITDGANNFNGLQFSVQQPDPLMDQARQAAVADGIAKAQLLAEAAGVTLGPVQSISEQGGGRPMMMEMAAARSGGAPIAAGEVTISASVVMVFGIAE